jgi:RHH-type proline utilization regulon transcriptional repressor/proline dehydrogenase/delta 1-pyrroline-5-carboxylate dehydrogenase
MDSRFEEKIIETGLKLFELVEGESPSVFRRQYWSGKILEWCMNNEAFKTEMFRFVDVFPALTRSESVAAHLQEYFTRPGLHFPSMFQWGLKSVSSSSLAAKMIAKAIGGNIASMARQFIVGIDPKHSLPQLEKLRSQGMAFTVDLLGEAVVSEKEAEGYLARYLDLLDILYKARDRWPAVGEDSPERDWGYSPRVNVSLKPSAMYSQMRACAFDHSIHRARERLVPVFRKAVETGASLTLDMEHDGLKNLTLALFRSLLEDPEFRGYPHAGIVIQAYRKDSETDLMELIQWAKDVDVRFSIRLVKGAYWDFEVIQARQRNWPVPVFTGKHETDASFEKLARIILENHERIRLACASHNMRSIACVMETAREIQVPEECIEYQVLYGMGEPVRNALRKAGLPLRLYTPIGELIQGMSYLVRRLLENTANESFLRQSFYQGIPREELLRNPLELLKEQPSPPEPDEEAPEYGDRGPFHNEPCWDWTRSEHREEFSRALRRLRASFPVEVHLVIDGKRRKTAAMIRSLNPNALHEVVGTVSSGTREDAEQAVSAAAKAFASWRDTPARERAEYLFRAASAARRMRYDLAALQVFEVGKSWEEADADVCEAIDFLEYYGREMIRLSVPRPMGRVPGEVSRLFYEPRGIAAVIAPWNFPLAISTGMTSAAIVTGNTVVYKPASQSPVVGSMVMQIFEEAQLPPGVINYLPGPGNEIGDPLTGHPDVSLIAFTGSMAVGLHIIELARKTGQDALCVKTVIAEMGGKNAIIVDADADLDEAVVQIIHSAFGYQGQKCSACSRLIVLEENYRKVVDRLVAAASSIHLGAVEDPKNFMGAVIEPAAREKILDYIEIGKREGSLLLERHVEIPGGNSVPLAIFEGIRPEHRLAREEIFGPVLAVIQVRDFDEALKVANNTPYALTGAVFSRSPANIARAWKEFRTGNLYINRGCTGALVGRHPFGGFKMSGIGSKAGGPDYLLQFMIPRSVAENTVRRGFAPACE